MYSFNAIIGENDQIQSPSPLFPASSMFTRSVCAVLEFHSSKIKELIVYISELKVWLRLGVDSCNC